MAIPTPTTVRELLPLLLQHPQLADTTLTRYLRVLQDEPPEPFHLTGGPLTMQVMVPFDRRAISLPLPNNQPTRESAADVMKRVLARIPDPIAVLKHSPLGVSPFTLIGLIPLVAHQLAAQSGGSVAVERAEILRDLRLHELLRFSDDKFRELCRALGQEPTFEGVCAVGTGRQLAELIATGFGLKDPYYFLAAQPDVYTMALTLQAPTRVTVGDTEVFFKFFTEPAS